jgi:hypothetical protein
MQCLCAILRLHFLGRTFTISPPWPQSQNEGGGSVLEFIPYSLVGSVRMVKISVRRT